MSGNREQSNLYKKKSCFRLQKRRSLSIGNLILVATKWSFLAIAKIFVFRISAYPVWLLTTQILLSTFNSILNHRYLFACTFFKILYWIKCSQFAILKKNPMPHKIVHHIACTILLILTGTHNNFGQSTGYITRQSTFRDSENVDREEMVAQISWLLETILGKLTASGLISTSHDWNVNRPDKV